MAKLPLLGLQAADFRHPLDQQATQQLQRLPGLDLLIRQLLSSGVEDFFHLNHLGAGIRISDRQLPHLHDLLGEACGLLDLDPPHLYLLQNPVPNAYTLAIRGKKPFVVLHTSLVEMLTPPEVQAVIAHELGHLKCDHGVYLTLANLFVLAIEGLPLWGTMVAESLRSQMLAWLRCAELSCDRAALLVVQDPRVVMSLLMKLAGGSPQLAPHLNLDAFLDQAREYGDLSRSALGETLRQTQTAPLTHPLPVLRAKEIDRWAHSPGYGALLQRWGIGYTQKREKKGEWRNW